MNFEQKKRMANLIAERGLRTSGFREAMRCLVDEYMEYDPDDEELGTWDEEAEFMFGEWFGDCRIVPAAFRIRRELPTNEDASLNRPRIWSVTVEVYEVEWAREFPDHKLAAYGDMADMEGPHFELHIIDKYDHEIVVSGDLLMQAWGAINCPDRTFHEYLKEIRSKAVAQHHPSIVIDDEVAPRLRKEIASLQSSFEDRVAEKFKDNFSQVIYLLGRRTAKKKIAADLGITERVVSEIADVLRSKAIDPKLITNDRHAAWKAAYDAVRELGLNV